MNTNDKIGETFRSAQCKKAIDEKLAGLYIFDTERGRRRFLADLTGTPLSSVIDNNDRLLEELKDWLIYG